MSLYPHEYVWTAYANEIVKGYAGGKFMPYASIIRGHVVTMTVRAMQRLHPASLLTVPADYVQSWGLDLSAEHSANARIAQYNGLLGGLPVGAGFGANGAMPREEVAQVLWNMMKKISPLGP